MYEITTHSIVVCEIITLKVYLFSGTWLVGIAWCMQTRLWRFQTLEWHDIYLIQTTTDFLAKVRPKTHHQATHFTVLFILEINLICLFLWKCHSLSQKRVLPVISNRVRDLEFLCLLVILKKKKKCKREYILKIIT